MRAVEFAGGRAGPRRTQAVQLRGWVPATHVVGHLFPPLFLCRHGGSDGTGRPFLLPARPPLASIHQHDVVFPAHPRCQRADEDHVWVDDRHHHVVRHRWHRVFEPMLHAVRFVVEVVLLPGPLVFLEVRREVDVVRREEFAVQGRERLLLLVAAATGDARDWSTLSDVDGGVKHQQRLPVLEEAAVRGKNDVQWPLRLPRRR